MKNPYFERTQPDNPHRLTVWQHILPKRSIERFCNQNGVVQVNWFEESKHLALVPGNEFFCAKRVWNQRAEDISVRTENAFQNIADLIVSNQINSLSQDMHIVVTKMYLLWRARYLHARDPIPDHSFLPHMTGDNLSIDQQEILEKKGYFYMKPDGTFPSRAMIGVLLQRDIGVALNEGAEKMQWGVVKSIDGLQFLCADVSLNQPLLPVSPKFCLVGGWPSGTATPFAVADINRALITDSERYWFALNPALCPVINRTNWNYRAPRPSYLSSGMPTP